MKDTFRFLTVIGALLVAVLVLRQVFLGGFILDSAGIRLSRWSPNEPAIIIVGQGMESHDLEHEPHPLDFVDAKDEFVGIEYQQLSAVYNRAIDFIESYRHPKSCSCCENGDDRRPSDKYDGLEGAQEFCDAVYTNIRREAHRDDLVAITAAIRFAEGGSPGREYGILHYECPDTYRGQAGWCAATVQKNWDRYLNAGGDSRDIYSYIDFLGGRYAPIGADNDPTGLNHNWTGLVVEAFNRLGEE